ncbi:hypothetical protein F5141DRAFT_1126378 [Pisolithus sp. B1]|nr:hypothetical protein F5141DRAFT_1126378 [Pisolithus sp. B1]
MRMHILRWTCLDACLAIVYIYVDGLVPACRLVAVKNVRRIPARKMVRLPKQPDQAFPSSRSSEANCGTAQQEARRI